MWHDNNNSSSTLTHTHTHLFDLVEYYDCLFSAWNQIENICDEFHRMCVVIGIRQLVIVVKWDRTIRKFGKRSDFTWNFGHTNKHTRTHTFTYTKYWNTKRLKMGWTKTPSKTSITNRYQRIRLEESNKNDEEMEQLLKFQLTIKSLYTI